MSLVPKEVLSNNINFKEYILYEKFMLDLYGFYESCQKTFHAKRYWLGPQRVNPRGAKMINSWRKNTFWKLLFKKIHSYGIFGYDLPQFVFKKSIISQLCEKWFCLLSDGSGMM